LVQEGFSSHELHVLHELLTAEVTAEQKLHQSVGIIQDAQLKALIQDSLVTKKKRIDQLEQLLKASPNLLQ